MGAGQRRGCRGARGSATLEDAQALRQALPNWPGRAARIAAARNKSPLQLALSGGAWTFYLDELVEGGLLDGDIDEAVGRWLEAALRDLLAIDSALERGVDAEKIERYRPAPMAVGASELHEWVRGRIWDCRKRDTDCCVVADFDAPFETHRKRLANYPDQTLVANLLEGVRLDADVEQQVHEQVVAVPHLAS